MAFYNKTTTEIFSELKSDEHGLTSKEAHARQAKYCKNILINSAIVKRKENSNLLLIMKMN